MRKLKKATSMLAVTALFTSMVPNLVYPVAAAAPMAGLGTVADPYVITDIDQLQAMSANLTASYVLGNDIDASATSGWNSGAGFVSIGTSSATPTSTCFSGKFDGRGLTINGLTINRPSSNYQGLFTCIAGTGVVQNVDITNANVSAGTASGILVGHATGTNVMINNVHISGTVTANAAQAGGLAGALADGTIQNSSANVSVIGSTLSNVGSSMGGLVGNTTGANSKIYDSHSSGNVVGYDYIGGLVGSLTDTSVQRNYSTANVSGHSRIGGLAGQQISAKILDSFAAGDVVSSGTTPQFAGGLVGQISTNVVVATITRSFSTSNVTGAASVGGLIGYAINGTIDQTYATGTVTGSSNVGGHTGYSVNTDAIITNSYTKSPMIQTGATVSPLSGFITYNSGSVSKSYTTGHQTVSVGSPQGFVKTNNRTVSSAYYDTTTTGATTSAAGTSKTTTQMKTQATFTGWDFTNVWAIDPTKNDGYPYLKNVSLITEAPSAPLSLSAAPNNDHVTLTWTAPTDSWLDHYNIYQDGVKVATAPFGTTTWTSPSLAYATYSYTVTVSNVLDIESSTSNTANVTLVDPTPAAPIGLTGIDGDAQVTLTWTANTEPNLAHYVVYKNNVAIATVPSGTTTYTASGLTNGTTYAFNISAVSVETVESAKSTTYNGTPTAPLDTTPPSAPLNLTASNVGTIATLAWDAVTAPDFAKYYIYKDGIKVAESNSPGWVLALTPGTYNFEVSAVDTAGNESAHSNTASVTILPPSDTTAPNTPMGLNVVVNNYTAELTWDANTEPDLYGYEVFIDGVKVATVPFGTETYTTTSLAVGTHTASITAVDTSSNISANTTDENFTINDTIAPQEVTTISETHTDTTATINWTVPSDLDFSHVNVYRDGAFQGTVVGVSFANTGLTPETTYVYTITTEDLTGNETTGVSISVTTSTTPTIPDTTAPNTPFGLIGIIDDGKAELSWTESLEPDLDHYNVYKDGVKVAEIPAGTEDWTSGTLADGTHVFTLIAVDESGNESTPTSPLTLTITTDSGNGNPGNGNGNPGNGNGNGNPGNGNGNGNPGNGNPGNGNHITVDFPSSPSTTPPTIEVEIPKDTPTVVDIPKGKGDGTPNIELSTPNGTLNIDGNTLPKDSGTSIIVSPTDPSSLNPGDKPTPIVTIDSGTENGASQPTITITKENPFSDDQYYTQNPDGTWEYVKPRKDEDGNWYVPIDKPILGVKVEDTSYSDIDDSWAKDVIEKLTNMHILNGYEDGTFRPNGEVTRAEYTNMLIKALIYKLSQEQLNKFEDVQPNAWYFAAIVEGQKVAIIKGISKDLFDPSTTINREQSTAIAVRWIEKTKSASVDTGGTLAEFKDAAETSKWAENELAKGVYYGVVQGSGGKIMPQKSTTRAEAATMIYNLINKY